MLLYLASANAGTLPRFVYRTIRVSSTEHRRALAGESLLARTPDAQESIRGHVLDGSGSQWTGSQYISTTSDLGIAVRFGAPCNPIVRIDLSRFPGDIVDLSSAEAFDLQIPPGDGDCGSSATLEKLRDMQKLEQAVPWLEDSTNRAERYIWESAAKTPWESARMFATRSKELLLSGEIPSSCYEILDYEVRTTGIEYLRGSESSFLMPPALELVDEWRPCDAPYKGLVAFQIPGDTSTLHLKQASANLRPELLSAEVICNGVDLEFAAFSFYRFVELRAPAFEVHVRDCAKVSFDVQVEGLRVSLKCMIFETIDTLQPARVAWRYRSEEEELREQRELRDSFGVSSQIFGTPSLSSSSRQFVVTAEDLVERWRDQARAEGKELAEADLARFIREMGSGKRFVLYRVLATEFALVALNAVAVDIFLANAFGWGSFDKAQLFRCTSSGKLYRMSADTALGASTYRTEHFNQDRREECANLAAETFFAAAANKPWFHKRAPVGLTRPLSREEVGPRTYLEQTGTTLPIAVEKQFESLCMLAKQHRAEVVDIFEALLIRAGPETGGAGLETFLAVTERQPPEEAMRWLLMSMCDPRKFWQAFVSGRLLHARRQFRTQIVEAMVGDEPIDQQITSKVVKILTEKNLQQDALHERAEFLLKYVDGVGVAELSTAIELVQRRGEAGHDAENERRAAQAYTHIMNDWYADWPSRLGETAMTLALKAIMSKKQNSNG